MEGFTLPFYFILLRNGVFIIENRYSLILDFKQSSFTNIKFVQNDIDTSILEFIICNQGMPINLTGQIISFAFLKPDNTLVIQDSSSGVTMLDAANGKIQCVLRSQTLASVGIVKGEISFTDVAGKKLSTAQFNFTVTSSIDNGEGIISSNEVALLDQAIINANEATADAILATENANSAEVIRVASEDIRLASEIGRVNTESVRVVAETSRISAENTRISSENTRISAEQSRNTAESVRSSAERLRISGETSRLNAESSRQTNETTRQSQEATRVSQESGRIVAESNRSTAYNSSVMIYKDPVANYATILTTYSSPSIGWVVVALDTGNSWRYGGTSWVNIGNTNKGGILVGSTQPSDVSILWVDINS